MKEVEVVSITSPMQFQSALRELVNDHWDIVQTHVTPVPEQGILYTAIMMRDGLPAQQVAKTNHFTQGL